MDTAPQSSLLSRRTKWLLAGAALASLVVTLVLRSISPPEIRAKLDAIKKAGYPITTQELAVAYPLPSDDQNSAIIYQKAFDALVSPPPNVSADWPVLSTNDPGRTAPLAPEVEAGISQYVADNQAALQLLHQGSLLPAGYYPTGWKNGFTNISLIPFVKIRQSAQLLALDAMVRAEQGNSAAAATAIVDLLALGRSLKSTPTLVAQMIRVAVLRIAAFSMERSLNRTRFTDAQLQTLALAFREADSTNELKKAFITQRCVGIWFFQTSDRKALHGWFSGRLSPGRLSPSHLLPVELQGLEDNLREQWMIARLRRSKNFILYLDLMQQLIDAAGQSVPKRMAVNDAIGQRIGGTDLDWVISNYKYTFRSDGEALAAMRAAQIALAIERYRLARQNQLPNTLADLVPSQLNAVGIDPFDDQPLRYKKLTNGCVIYSIGGDGIDNGGLEKTSTIPNNQPYDVTFTVEH